jgi:hypothetical protein
LRWRKSRRNHECQLARFTALLISATAQTCSAR